MRIISVVLFAHLPVEMMRPPALFTPVIQGTLEKSPRFKISIGGSVRNDELSLIASVVGANRLILGR